VDFVIIAAEFNGAGFDRICEFRAREAFRRHDLPEVQQSPGLLLEEDEFRIDGAMLDHGIPCLAFALTEKLRVNVWREGLRQLELPVGQWLREAKRAVRQGAPADRQISIRDDLSMSLGVLEARRASRCKRFFGHAPCVGFSFFKSFVRLHRASSSARVLATAARAHGKCPTKATAILRRAWPVGDFIVFSECYYIFRNLVAPRSPGIQPRLVAVLERNGQLLGE
jgi:hypothetical protein